jgi:hypothetical protein
LDRHPTGGILPWCQNGHSTRDQGAARILKHRGRLGLGSLDESRPQEHRKRSCGRALGILKRRSRRLSNGFSQASDQILGIFHVAKSNLGLADPKAFKCLIRRLDHN